MTNLNVGELKEMALMLSQHCGWHIQERSSRDMRSACRLIVTRANLLSLELLVTGYTLGRTFSLPIIFLLAVFFLTTGGVFCLRYIFWRSSSSSEVSLRILVRVTKVGSRGERLISRLLVICCSLERCSRASGRP